MSIKQARPLKRRRSTDARLGQIEAQILAALRTDRPQSVRHVFYRMTDPRLPEPVEKSERGYGVVQRRMTAMRRDGSLPYGWVADATRGGYHVPVYGNAADFLRRTADFYRSDQWTDADHYVDIWCESRSLAGVIQGECEDLAVSLYPAGGFTSLTLAYEAATRIQALAMGRPVEVIYIGDYDPAGVLIDRSIERELAGHLDGLDLTFHRIAITQEQIEAYDLPTKPRKAGDRRAPHIAETVEAEAMPAGIMRSLLRASIERFLPPRALDIARATDATERARLVAMADRLEAGAPL